jgi:hypothetical protein
VPPFAPVIVPIPVAAEADAPVRGVAMDGTAQRGRLPFQQGGGPVQALTAFCPEQGGVLAQEPIEPGQGAEKGEAEVPVAPALLACIAWPGRVLTGAALFCQQVLAAGGDDLLLVEVNQPTLSEELRLRCAPPAWPPCPYATSGRRARSTGDTGDRTTGASWSPRPT